uniref:Glycerophosphoryl diester phosphodiesterase membrane domain-containing protein n=1 Tax=Fundidesulfovibrio putealis TaxID=270496 RepID=A0A7C4AHU7_9BACT
MHKLPVFSTLVQAMAVFGLHLGKLVKWALIPLFAGLGPVGLTIGLAAWQDALGKGFNLWLVPVAVAVIFAIQTMIPFAIRVNQLAVLGRVEKTGYLEMIFSGQSFRYLGYGCIVALIMAGGIVLAIAPAVVLGSGVLQLGASRSMLPWAVGVSVILSIWFFILTIPFNLVYPAVAVEREPSLMKAYHLGSGNKARLFFCVLLATVLFGALTLAAEMLPNLFLRDPESPWRLVFLPVQLFLSLFNHVTSQTVPAVAYRILSGLPDPAAPERPAGHPGQEQAPGAGPRPRADAPGQGDAGPAPERGNSSRED